MQIIFPILISLSLVIDSVPVNQFLKWKHKKKDHTTKVIPIVFTSTQSTITTKQSFNPLV